MNKLIWKDVFPVAHTSEIIQEAQGLKEAQLLLIEYSMCNHFVLSVLLEKPAELGTLGIESKAVQRAYYFKEL